jgi:hypothetical protein
MTNKFRNASAAAFVLGLALTALASPVSAEYPVSAAREAALRECNVAASKYTAHIWLSMQIQTYRSCMAGHGEPE